MSGWQTFWVLIIFIVLAFIGFESYVNVLKERTEIAKATLKDELKRLAALSFCSVDDRTETRLGNGDA